MVEGPDRLSVFAILEQFLDDKCKRMCYHRFMAHTLSDEEDGVAAYLEKWII